MHLYIEASILFLRQKRSIPGKWKIANKEIYSVKFVMLANIKPILFYSWIINQLTWNVTEKAVLLEIPVSLPLFSFIVIVRPSAISMTIKNNF